MKSLQQGTIPHALATAYAVLVEALNEGIKQFESDLRFANAPGVCRAVERFVDALNQQPGGREELQWRAMMIEVDCGAGSEYESARTEAWKIYGHKALRGLKARIKRHSIKKPKQSTAEHELLANIVMVKPTMSPQYLSEVSHARAQIEWMKENLSLNATPGALAAYQRWLTACRDVQQKADPLEVDGCRYLYHLHEAAEDNPSENAKSAKAIMHTDLGGPNLAEMKSAADSLMRWGSEPQAALVPLSEQSRPVVSEPQAAVVPLAERAKCVLEAMLDAKAFDSDHLLNASEIVFKAVGTGADPNPYKSVMSFLKLKGLVDSRRGPGGGSWLTELGRSRAENLKPKL